MKQGICFFLVWALSLSVHASLIKYDITNEIVNLATNEVYVGPMEVIFDSKDYSLVSLEIDVFGVDWYFVGNEEVIKSANAVSTMWYEIFALFSVSTLTNSIFDNAEFSATEWKVYSADPGFDVLSGLGELGPRGIGALKEGGVIFGVTSSFDKKTLIEVDEPPAIALLICPLIFFTLRFLHVQDLLRRS